MSEPLLPAAEFPGGVPVLTDGHVLLRAHSVADAPRVLEQCLDPESVRWTTIPRDYTIEMAHEFLEVIAADWQAPDGHRYWAITDASDPETFLGTIDIRPRGAGIAEIGFGLHPEGRGRHLMSGAVRLVTGWWFNQGGVRMLWYANRGNVASWRVAHSCGFTFHGILPEHLGHRGEAVDAYYASIGRDGDLTRPVTTWIEAPVLEGETVRLRPWRDDDIEQVPESDDTPAHFVPPRGIPTRSTFEGWLLRRRERVAQGALVQWCIADRETDAALGCTLLIRSGQERGTAELGYFLLGPGRGRGAATEGAGLVATYAFRPAEEGGLGLRRLVALTVGDNERSARVLERLGFAEWGREPQFCERADGSFDDARRWVRFPG